MNIRSREDIFGEQQRLVQAHSIVSPKLKSYPNVVSVGVGVKESDGYLTHQLCYRVYVDKKQAPSDLKAQEIIPKRIMGFLTDVIVVGEIGKCADYTKFRPLEGGGMIRTARYAGEGKNTRGAGTMGMIVNKNGTSQLMGLTCHHVVDDGVNSDITGAFPAGILVGQPRYITCCCCCHYNEIGNVFQSKKDNDVDCALVDIGAELELELKGGVGHEAETSNNAINTVNGIGVITGVAQAQCWETVRKRGAGTGLTTGTVVDVMFGVNSNQLLVQENDPTKDFADNGDSGAVLVNASNQVVGLLWGVQRKTAAMLAAERAIVNPGGATAQATRTINAATVPATATQGNTAGRAALEGHGVANHIAPVMTALDISIAGQGVQPGMGIASSSCAASSSTSSVSSASTVSSSSVGVSSASAVSSSSTTSSAAGASSSSAGSASSLGSSSSSSSIPIVDLADWKAWPGGQPATSLNIYETFRAADFGFAGNCDWNVGNGGVAGTIQSTGTSTATGKATIKVRFDTVSPSNSAADSAYIECIQGGSGKRMKRTVFQIFINGRNTSGALHASNALRFPADTGTDTAFAGFNRQGDNAATRYAAKVEIRFSILPTNIDWAARGIRFRQQIITSPSPDQKFDLVAMRDNKFTDVMQRTTNANRVITTQDYANDGEADPGDCQYPSVAVPNFIFRIDGPGFNRTNLRQGAFRDAFREFIQFHDGSTWRRISYYAYWYCNITAILPTGAPGLPNDLGTGEGADPIPNNAPVANAGPDQAVGQGVIVNLAGSATDADNDQIVTYTWRQVSGTAVVLSNVNAQNPSFTSPGAPGVLVFGLIVADNTNTPRFASGSHLSAEDTVTITVT